MVRITDRGPFIEGRIIDLSQAAAQKIGLVRKGTAPVRMEVLKTPQPIEVGGRWAVQIGGFETEDTARDMAGHLTAAVSLGEGADVSESSGRLVGASASER